MKTWVARAALTTLTLTGCANIETDAPSASRAATTPATRTATIAPGIAAKTLPTREVATLEAPVDLWDRIRRGFAIEDLDDALVHQHEQQYLKSAEYLQRMVDRSRLYLFHVVEALELNDMPTELALLPYIESAFNPQAVSNAKAAGLWQFMPATGRDYRLTQDALRDDRRNVLESTRAALEYLEMLHDMFDDWQLALAAYNWGQGNVKQAIERNERAGRGTRYADLQMPNETRNYVPKLQAIKNIIARPQVLGTTLPVIENHPFFDQVEIAHDIDVVQAARLANVQVGEFEALNPAQRKPVILASITPRILLPWRNALQFRNNLKLAGDTPLASWTAWVAPSDMSVAEVAVTTHTDAAQLQQINQLVASRPVRAGSTLVVRRDAQPSGAVTNRSVTPGTPSLRRREVQARRGDTVASLAARYDLPAATVANWNRLKTDSPLSADQTITLYLPAEIFLR